MKLDMQGRAHVKLDAKGRVHLPTRFRTSLSRENQLVITNSIHAQKRYLDVHSVASWQKLIQQIGSLPTLRSDVQSFQRYYISSGETVELDSQGRFLIPNHFRQFATLNEDIVMIGVGGKLEIWSDDNWNKLLSDLENRFDDVMSSIAQLTENSNQRSRPNRRRSEGHE